MKLQIFVISVLFSHIFSHLREHKFRHGFLDIFDPICSCRTNEIENTERYLLHCSNFANQRTVSF